MAVGLWVCACSSDASYIGSGSGPTQTGAASGVGFGGSSTGAGGKSTGKGGAGVTIPSINQLCPELGVGSAGFGVSMGGGSAGVGNATGGRAAAGAGEAPGLAGAGGQGGADVWIPCPSEPPIDLVSQACPGPGACPYIDGTNCQCEACDDGWCWHCDVADLPFGCPRIPPKNGESCGWTGVTCTYGSCEEWRGFTSAVCCFGEWRATVTSCFGP